MNKYLQEIASSALINEKQAVEKLLNNVSIFKKDSINILKKAEDIIGKIRTLNRYSSTESFLKQYSLNTAEGIAVMCLAEALLRIPDSKTADALIKDKFSETDWQSHIGKSDSLFVNASTWGFMLTGKLVGHREFYEEKNTSVVIKNLIGKLGAPVFRNAIKTAITVMSKEFIMGENIVDALDRAKNFHKKSYSCSYDILGEGARTKIQSEVYFQEYIQAIKAIGDKVDKNKSIYEGDSISIKLTALHPRFELKNYERLEKELYPRIKEIILYAKEKNIAVSFDAEESYRLDAYLKIFTKLIQDEDLKDYNGLGAVVQAYQKRGYSVVKYIAELAKENNKIIPIRLVKGAYWDSEVKHAQVYGLKDYPVFTRKEFTDLSYIVCARLMFEYEDNIYPQFATHNAVTVAAILDIAKNKKFEFQRLHGMGESLYDNVDELRPCRIYSPVGKQEALLPYLMRRLLENGANSSFVHQLIDDHFNDQDITIDPISQAEKYLNIYNNKIMNPKDLFGHVRKNSSGFDLGYIDSLNYAGDIVKKYANKTWKANPIICGKEYNKGEIKEIFEPADNSKKVGDVVETTAEQAQKALELANKYYKRWDSTHPGIRAEILDNIAEEFEKDTEELLALLMREAGKTMDDAVAEVREAIDFCRYYASQIKEKFVEPIIFAGPTGEKNLMTLNARGVFLCISPWNFPLAIFTGQIVAALAAGNAVLAKPAELTSLVAAKAISLMLKAGVPEEILHFIPGKGSVLGDIITKDKNIAGVAFTGSTITAQRINQNLANRDGAIVPLIAETGGQNVMIIDSSALLEQAVDDIISSGFKSAGQRCSALRVLYIQEEIYNDLVDMLKGAMDELKIAHNMHLNTDVGPVISQNARKGLISHIENMRKNAIILHQTAIEPSNTQNGYFVAPTLIEIQSIKELEEENFGPVIHVISFKINKLDEVIDDINSTGYGLTFGVHSRVEDRINYLRRRITAGNIYANRNMIGAVVGVQPFGGQGLSGTGPKAGGPHYLLRFANEKVFTNNIVAFGGNLELLCGDE